MFYELREYLEQTDADIPQKLEKHPAAHAAWGKNARGRPRLRSARGHAGGRVRSTRGSSSRGK